MQNDLIAHNLSASGYVAHVAQGLTYKEYQDIEAALYSGMSTSGGARMEISFNPEAQLRWQRKKIMVLVKKVTNSSGEDVPFTEQWLDALPLSDAMRLEAIVEEVILQEKKRSKNTGSASTQP